MPRAGRHNVSFASVNQNSKCIRPSQISSAHRVASAAELSMHVWTFKAASVEFVRRAKYDPPTPGKLTQGQEKIFMSKNVGGDIDCPLKQPKKNDWLAALALLK